MDDYVKRFADEIEESADQILAEEKNPRIRANALLWKTNGISACFQAAARPDALSAFLDVWILNKQSTALLERPAASHLFGGWQKLALETCQRLEGPLAEIQSKIGSDFPIGEDFVTSFANDYPITSLYFRRESVAARYTDYMERIDIANRELMDVVGGLDERLDQLHKLSALYAEFLPKQARWQGELMLLEAVPTSILAAPLDDLAMTAEAIDRIARVGEEVPYMVERERDNVLQAVADERVAALDAVDQMLVKTMAQLREERVAVLAAMRDERLAVSKELSGYAHGMLSKTESTLDHGLDEMTQRAEHITDHAFKRLAQLGLATLVCLAVALLVAMRAGPVRRNLHLETATTDSGEVPSRLHRERNTAA
jgi:hypothetical protein